MPAIALGIITQRGRILQLHNAVVQEVFISSRTTGYLDIVYAKFELNEARSESLRLNVDINTVILNSIGQQIFLSNIEKGMLVDSLFPPIRETPKPPHSDAYLIVARNYNQPPLSFIIGRIARVDVDNSNIYIGDPNNTENQTKFFISNATTIHDIHGNSVPLYSLHPGLIVDVLVTHANLQQTFTPNEADALHIQIL